MTLPRFFLLSIVTILTFFLLSGRGNPGSDASAFSTEKKSAPPTAKSKIEKLQQKGALAKKFVLQKKYNDQYCFLIDMSLASGQHRFFIYDLRNDSIIHSAPVAHGNCFEYWLEGRRYSNVVGSGCTSLGKYKIGIPYTGKWGYSYKLHGLDSSNNNAFERTVVLHGHSCVPDNAVNDEICQSNGCPTVAPGFLLTLKKMINGSAKPMLLWIFD
ncbi:MAG: murein L,D-transpeptidase catalytic domain family protein [Chitinophagaceae bacterium]|nr:murein L,D-transpeptidase catalytic domain family protein [Chitinophagaceae bacterium]